MRSPVSRCRPPFPAWSRRAARTMGERYHKYQSWQVLKVPIFSLRSNWLVKTEGRALCSFGFFAGCWLCFLRSARSRRWLLFSRCQQARRSPAVASLSRRSSLLTLGECGSRYHAHELNEKSLRLFRPNNAGAADDPHIEYGWRVVAVQREQP